MITMQDAERAAKEAEDMHAAARAAMEKALAARKQARTLRSIALIWLELQKMNPQDQAGAIAELRRIAEAPNGRVDPLDYRNQAPPVASRCTPSVIACTSSMPPSTFLSAWGLTTSTTSARRSSIT